MNDLLECLQQATAAAARVVQKPALFTVLVDLANRAGETRPAGFSFGFQHRRRSWRGQAQLDTCFVEVQLASRTPRVISSGTYGPESISQLSSVPGFDFPPPSIEPRAVAQVSSTRDVLEHLRARQVSPGRLLAEQVALSLCSHDGRLAWRAVHDVPGVGVRTLIVDAVGGGVLFEKFDEEVSSQA